MIETEIDGRLIPIEAGPKAIITFSGGKEGPHEAGTYEFWASVGPLLGDCVRCRAGADPGERFRRMEGDPKYKDAWGRTRRAKRLRPATRDNVESWLNTHDCDARHATTGQVGGEKVRVAIEKGHYRVVPDRP